MYKERLTGTYIQDLYSTFAKCCLIGPLVCLHPLARRLATSQCQQSKLLQHAVTTAAAILTVVSPPPSHCGPPTVMQTSVRRHTSKAGGPNQRGTTPNRIQPTVLLHRMASTCVATAISWSTRRELTSSRWRCSFNGRRTLRVLSSNDSTRRTTTLHSTKIEFTAVFMSRDHLNQYLVCNC